MSREKFRIDGDLSLNVSPFLKEISKARGALKGMDGIEVKKLHSLFAELSAEIKDYETAARRTFSNTSEIKKTAKIYENLEDKIKQIGILLDSTDFGLKNFNLDKSLKKGQKALVDFEMEGKRTQATLEKLHKQMGTRFQAYVNVEELVQAAKAGEELGTQLRTLRGQTSIALKVDEGTYNDSKQKLAELVRLRDEAEKAESAAKNRQTEIEGWKRNDGKKESALKEQALVVKEASAAYKQAADELAAVEKEYTSNIEKFEEGRKLPKIIEGIVTAYEDLKLASQEIELKEIFGDHLTEALEKGEQGIDSLKASVESLAEGSVPEAIAEQTRDLGDAYKELGKQTEGIKDNVTIWEQQSQEILDVDRQVQALQRSMLQFFTVTSGWNMLRKSMQEAYQTVKQLDAAMTEIAVVSDYTLDQIWEMRRGYSDAATEMGAKTIDLIDATKLYVQQGLSLAEAQEIGIETIKMARIANLEGEEATTLMTAAIRGFHMELSEANRVNDTYSNLAAKSAADTQEIATAMSKTASIASSAGAEFENMSAFLTQIIETTREAAETAGTAMKTIIARFQELKKPMDEIGEIDGEIVDANAIETALRSAGVALRDVNGEFRDFDQVIIELSEKWDTLDVMTQRYIATMAAGSRLNERITDYKSCELRESA